MKAFVCRKYSETILILKIKMHVVCCTNSFGTFAIISDRLFFFYDNNTVNAFALALLAGHTYEAGLYKLSTNKKDK